MKKRIRLTEGQLYRLIEQAVCGLLNDDDNLDQHLGSHRNRVDRRSGLRYRKNKGMKPVENTDFCANGYGCRPSVDVNGYGCRPSVDVNGYFAQRQANRMAESIIRRIKHNRF